MARLLISDLTCILILNQHKICNSAVFKLPIFTKSHLEFEDHLSYPKTLLPSCTPRPPSHPTPTIGIAWDTNCYLFLSILLYSASFYSWRPQFDKLRHLLKRDSPKIVLDFIFYFFLEFLNKKFYIVILHQPANFITRLCLLPKLFSKICFVFHAQAFDNVIKFKIIKFKVE